VRYCKSTSEKVTILVDKTYNELTDFPETSTMVALEQTTALANQYSLGNYATNQAGVTGALASYS